MHHSRLSRTRSAAEPAGLAPPTGRLPMEPPGFIILSSIQITVFSLPKHNLTFAQPPPNPSAWLRPWTRSARSKLCKWLLSISISQTSAPCFLSLDPRSIALSGPAIPNVPCGVRIGTYLADTKVKARDGMKDKFLLIFTVRRSIIPGQYQIFTVVLD